MITKKIKICSDMLKPVTPMVEINFTHSHHTEILLLQT